MKARTDCTSPAHRRVLPLPSWVIGASLIGCVSASDHDDESSNLAMIFGRDSDHGGEHAQDPTASIVRDPDGRYEGAIVTSGAGCPEGTTRARLTDDGRALELDFRH